MNVRESRYTIIPTITGGKRPPKFLPKGKWLIIKNFSFSQGGALTIGFKKDSFLRSDGAGKIETSKDGEKWFQRDFSDYGRGKLISFDWIGSNQGQPGVTVMNSSGGTSLPAEMWNRFARNLVPFD